MLFRSDSKPVSTLQRFLLDKKDSEINIFDYSNHLWNLANKIIPQKGSVWLYAPGDKARLWEDFYKDGIMAIGWDELHDLSRYKDQMEINMDIQQHYDTNKNKSNDAKSCYDFCHNIKIGDTIIVKKGLYEILGVGIVRSDYYFDDTAEEFCHKRNVSWISKGCWRYPTYLPQKTLTKKDLSFKKDIMEIINKVEMPQKSKEIKSILLSKKQIILQGAPGTGKTYNTAELAVAICNKDFSDFGNREAVMTEYNNLKKSGQIAFTTFHQSMDYEEFVEGLRPVNNNDGVTFETKNRSEERRVGK